MIAWIIVYVFSVAVCLYDTNSFRNASLKIKSKSEYDNKLITKTLWFFLTLSFIPGFNSIVAGIIICTYIF